MLSATAVHPLFAKTSHFRELAVCRAGAKDAFAGGWCPW